MGVCCALPPDETPIIGSGSLSACPLAKGPELLRCAEHCSQSQAWETGTGWRADKMLRLLLCFLLGAVLVADSNTAVFEETSSVWLRKGEEFSLLEQLKKCPWGSVYPVSPYSVSGSLIPPPWEPGGQGKAIHSVLTVQSGSLLQYEKNTQTINFLS